MMEAKKLHNIQCINDDLNYLDREREYIFDAMSGILIPKPLKFETIKNYIDLNISDFLKYNKDGKNKEFIKKYIKFLIELDDYILIQKRNIKNGNS